VDLFVIESTMSGYLAFFPSGHQDNWMTVQFLPAVHQVPMSIQLCSQRTPIKPVPINNLALVIDALHRDETGLEWKPHLLQWLTTIAALGVRS
jgi:hypothetical protein